MRVTVLVLIAFAALQAALLAGEQVGPGTSPAGAREAGAAPATVTNEMCPVMRGNKVDPNVYVDYKGKRVYFCCTDCQATFLENPEPYLQYLPQFASATSPQEGQPAATAAPEAGRPPEAPKPAPRVGITRVSLIIPMGITTFSLLVLTAGAGMFMRRKPRVLLKLHRRLAVATLLSACTHAFLVLFR
jgi:YHS domain-containing protein